MAMAFKGFGSRPGFEYASDQGGFGLPQLSGEVVAAGQQAPASGGFFSEGGTGRNIAGYLGDYLAQLGGARPLFAPVMQQRQALQQAEQQRQRGFQDWVSKQEWERANPKPINNDTVADYEFIRSKLGDAAGEEYLRNKANPPVWRQGSDGVFYRVDTPQGAAGGQLPTFSQDDWDKAGGSAGNGTGGFPR